MYSRRVLHIIIGLIILVPAVMLGHSGAVRADAPGPHASRVGPGQSTPDQRVIILLKNQHPELRGRFSAQVRADTIRREQAPILAELSRVHASRILAYHLINAVATTVSSAEAVRLRATAAVAAVVPDRALSIPGSSRIGQPAASAVGAKSVKTNSAYTCPSTPTLEPEGLSLTHTLTVPTTITGAGVKVGVVADVIDPNNPEFIRPDGSHVIVDYKDFSGVGTAAPGDGSETFGDVGTIAAQAKQTYNAYSNAVPKHTGACPIKIRGVAPGVGISVLNVFGHSAPFESLLIEAVQYAADQHLDVLNESLDAPEYPVRSDDPLLLAEDTAIADGVTIVASSGDSGIAGATSALPADDPEVISVGATTQLRLYAEAGQAGFPLSNGQWLSNNVAAFSSSGFTPNGTRSVDLVAPGEASWIPCTADTSKYSSCTDAAGHPASFIGFEGTSESAPFVSGESALVIQAYRSTHSGASPSPALVKQFITGTTDDLGIPSNLQGAGLMDSARAVQAAMSYRDSHGSPAVQGAALLGSPSSLAKTDQQGAAENFAVNVTNDSAVTEAVKPSVRTLGRPIMSKSFALTLDRLQPPTFVDQSGSQNAYQKQTFIVPAGIQRLQASISWDLVSQPTAQVSVLLLDPQGRYANWSDPYGISGFGQTEVRNPAAGIWTAVIFTYAGRGGYTGFVNLSVSASRFVTVQPVIVPSTVQIAPGQTQPVSVLLSMPVTAGDASDDIVLTGTAPNHPSITSVIPLYLRTLIPMGQSGGTFSGILTGGNGRLTMMPSVSYQFVVPSGLRDLDLGISLADSHYNLTGFLLDPSGTPVEAQTTITAFNTTTFLPSAFTNTMQFFHRNPVAGRWTFLLLITATVSGQQTSLPFTGAVTFNGVSVQAPTLPNDPNISLPSGHTLTVPITITNTGNTTKSFFPDARLPGSLQYHLVSSDRDDTLPPAATHVTTPPVAPESSDFTVVSTSPDGPMALDLAYIGGGQPKAGAGEPFVHAVAQFSQGTYTATTDYMPPDASTTVPSGVWGVAISPVGTFGAGAAPTTHVHTEMYVTTAPWDTSIDSDTGDIWKAFYPGSSTPFDPLTLAPGATGTIHLTITPFAQDVGKVIQGHIYIDTLLLASGGDANSGSGDELVALPYEYKVG